MARLALAKVMDRAWLIILMVGVVALAAACAGDATPTATSVPATPTATSAPGVTPPPPTPTPTSRPATPTPTPEPVSFADKRIRFIVGYGAGGGFDAFARVMAIHFQQALPGNPRVVVANLPGADSLVAARRVMDARVRDDEVTIVVFNITVITGALLGTVEFDPAQPAYIGLPDATDTRNALCGRTEVVSNLDDLLSGDRKYLAGASAGGISGTDIWLKFLQLMGINMDVIYGYSGGTERDAALNRGEIDLSSSCNDARQILYPFWLDENFVVPLVCFGECPRWVPEGQAQGKWADVQGVFELGEGRLSAAQMAAMQIYMDTSLGTRVFAVAPGTDPGVVDALRSAFADAVTSQAFIADMTARGRGDSVGLLTGDAFKDSMVAVLGAPPETLEILRQVIAPGALVQ